MSMHQTPIPNNIISFLWQMMRSFRWQLFGLVLVSILWALDLSLRPYVVKIILDRLNLTPNHQIIEALWGPALFYIALSAAIVMVFRLYDFINLSLYPALRKKVQDLVMSYLTGHSYSYFQNNFAGNLSNKINDVAIGSQELISIVIDRFFSNGLALLIAVITFASVHWMLALIMLVWAFLFAVVTLKCAQKLEQLSYVASETHSKVIGKVVDVLSNNMAVRLFSRREFEQNRLAQTLEKSVERDKALQWFALKLYAFQGVSFLLMISVCLGFLVWGRAQGIISIGDFALILSLAIHIADCLWGLSKDFSDFIENLGRLKQGLSIVSVPYEVTDVPFAQPLKVRRGEICFDNVRFWYKGGAPLFDQLSVKINPGEKVGLVGFSGSGKTTFVNLIMRLFDIQQGVISVDGQDISQITQESLRQQIAFIPQEPTLFHRNVIENIRYGRIEASDEEVIEAAKRAHAHDFIMSLPEGYLTKVGERGNKISGGQRQRIVIARAFLKNAPILILDEATSALDTLTEHQIQQSLNELMGNKTTLVIAHRLSTLLHMDRILVFEAGQIIEQGSHRQLIEQDGLYARLWQSQIDGFLQEG
jgi:ATP-binding cassette, subfamily B, bacterial